MGKYKTSMKYGLEAMIAIFLFGLGIICIMLYLEGLRDALVLGFFITGLLWLFAIFVGVALAIYMIANLAEDLLERKNNGEK